MVVFCKILHLAKKLMQSLPSRIAPPRLRDWKWSNNTTPSYHTGGSRKYDLIVNADSTKVLIYKQEDGASLYSCQQVAKYSNIFDIIWQNHEIEEGNNHPKSKVLFKHMSSKYGKIIPCGGYEIFPDFCPICVCEKQRNKGNCRTPASFDKRHEYSCTVRHYCLSEHAWWPIQVCAGLPRSWYKALSATSCAKSHISVTLELISIFLVFGTPSILQVDNRREFSNTVSKSWPVPLDNEVFHCEHNFTCFYLII